MEGKSTADPNNVREMDIEKDLNRVTEIWLNEVKHTHKGFICKDFWESRIFSFISEILSTKDEHELYVYEEGGKVQGFITARPKKNLSSTAYIDELYVDYQYQGKKHQNKTIGESLLDTLKGKYSYLTLSVYKQNSKAVEFYKKHYFRQVGNVRTEDITKLEKIDMEWSKEKENSQTG